MDNEKTVDEKLKKIIPCINNCDNGIISGNGQTADVECLYCKTFRNNAIAEIKKVFEDEIEETRRRAYSDGYDAGAKDAENSNG